ncbi:hypothetical protein HHK36_007415 [Tetracentron sinense]|uniref:PDZ domain-containing protein n=1 Tax=Tetracentron sinense TaxID=13715 RepID=A0A834ZJR4_TETSI|nr:hypothetical protein HHK36_007415 [Tetracentron sinense]
MAACSLYSSATTNPTVPRCPSENPNFTLSKSLSLHKNPNLIRPVLCVLRNNGRRNTLTSKISNLKFPCLNKLFHMNFPYSSALDSLFVLCTSLALSFSLFVADVDAAAAFVVTTPRKLQSDELATVRLFQDNTPSVVFITNLAVRQDAFTLDVLEVPQGSGSGFVWDKDGHIVTNYHVIRGASDLRLFFPLHSRVFGLDHTLTTGVISGLRREISSAATGRPIQDVIQTDAAINPGNSGGPLLDSSGNLIGINTAIYSPSGTSSGVGFSIPVDTVGGIVDQLVKFGKVTRPILGIKFAPDQSVEQLGVGGVLVLDAPANGPAGKAGLQPTKRDTYGRLILGDIITSVNGKKVTSGSDLYRILDQCKVGDQVMVEVLRGDHKENIPVILEPKPDES